MQICTRCEKQFDDPEYKRCAKCRAKRCRLNRLYYARRKKRDPEWHRKTIRRANRSPNRAKNVQRYKAKNPQRWRAYHSAKTAEWRRAHRAEQRVRYQLRKALAMGEIVKPDRCEKCGREVKLTALLVGLDYHDVEWRCWPCHMIETGVTKS